MRPLSRRAAIHSGIALLLAASLAGCGDGLELGQVSGRVTVDGKPIPHGVVIFQPVDGPAAVGAIEPDGSYTMTTLKAGDGAVVGEHRVAIQATTVSGAQLVEAKSLEEEVELTRKGGAERKYLVPGKVTWLAPERYSRPETSSLTATVEPGANTVDFNLEGDAVGGR